MHKNSIHLTASLLLLSMFLFSCQKNEGEGGNSAITGKIFYNYYDHNGKLIASEPAIDEDVFIIYGDDDFYSDDVKTNENGIYKFNYLTEGNYKLFAYEDCKACYSGDSKVETVVVVSGKTTIAVASDMELTKNLDVNDGYSVLKGKVKVEDYDGTGALVATYAASDTKVYLVYDTDSTYYDDIRTNSDGTYEFRNLIRGTYKIYAYSKCDKENNQANYNNCQKIIESGGKIENEGDIVTIPEIVIYN